MEAEVGGYSVRPLSSDIPIREMYKYSKLPNTDYGIEGYEVPNIHFDHIRKRQGDEDFKLNVAGRKRRGKPLDMKVKKDGGMNRDIELRAKATPGPWNYDIKQEWIHGPTSKQIDEIPSKDRQVMKYKWKGVGKDDREIQSRPKTSIPKLDMSVTSLLNQVKKYSYIDHIVMKHTKKDYPLPGPADHFHDAQTMKKIPEENRDIFVVPKKDQKAKSRMG